MDINKILEPVKKQAASDELFLYKKDEKFNSICFVDTGNVGIVIFSNKFVYRVSKPNLIMSSRILEKIPVSGLKEVKRQSGMLSDPGKLDFYYNDCSKKSGVVGKMFDSNASFGLVGFIYDAYKSSKETGKTDESLYFIKVASGLETNDSFIMNNLS